MRMRFRTDGWHYADLKAAGETIESYFREDDPWRTDPEVRKCWDETPKAEPGDVWRILWKSDAIAGYAICCPGCRKVHHWTTARNCANKITNSYTDSKTGEVKTYESCIHSGNGSCWNWSGSAEENNLSATPSLQVTADDCKWHGYITNGDIHN